MKNTFAIGIMLLIWTTLVGSSALLLRGQLARVSQAAEPPSSTCVYDLDQCPQIYAVVAQNVFISTSSTSTPTNANARTSNVASTSSKHASDETVAADEHYASSAPKQKNSSPPKKILSSNKTTSKSVDAKPASTSTVSYPRNVEKKKLVTRNPRDTAASTSKKATFPPAVTANAKKVAPKEDSTKSMATKQIYKKIEEHADQPPESRNPYNGLSIQLDLPY